MNRRETEELIKRLEERHTPTIIPPCPVCGDVLGLASCGGGGPTIYACSPSEEDPEKPGYLRRKAVWDASNGHYVKSRFIDCRHDDPDVLILIEEFRKLQMTVGGLCTKQTHKSASEEVLDAAFGIDSGTS